jgi:hypothetical protein
MSETTELKHDVGFTYRAILFNAFGHAEVEAVGCRQVVENKIKEWVPLLMAGDSIQFTRMEKE